jgi:hypothetical protein
MLEEIVMRHGVSIVLLLVLVGCGGVMKAERGSCIQVRYEMGGRATMATAYEVERVSDTTVRLRETVMVDWRARSYLLGPVEITSPRIGLSEGSCWPRG